MGMVAVKEGSWEEVTSKMSPHGSLCPFTLLLGSSLSTPLPLSGTPVHSILETFLSLLPSPGSRPQQLLTQLSTIIF